MSLSVDPDESAKSERDGYLYYYFFYCDWELQFYNQWYYWGNHEEYLISPRERDWYVMA